MAYAHNLRFAASAKRKIEMPMTEDDLSAEHSIGHWLRRAQQAVLQDFNDSFAQHDLRPAEISLVLLLRREPGLKQCDAAERLGIQRANFVSLVDNLERREVIERRKSDIDRRVQALYLTDEGEAFANEMQVAFSEHEQRMIERLGGRDTREKLMGLLAAISS